eukprot:4031455-Pyramimonas_sp.AAC.1
MKAAETTAAWLPNGVPRVAPLRGISRAPPPWAATAQRDLADFGINVGDRRVAAPFERAPRHRASAGDNGAR